MSFSYLTVIFLIFLGLSNRIEIAVGGDSFVDQFFKPTTEDPNKLHLWLTISAQKQFLEVSWKNAPAREGDNIVLTKQEPHNFQKIKRAAGTPLAGFAGAEIGGFLPLDGYTTPSHVNGEGSGYGDHVELETSSAPQQEYWISSNGQHDIVAAVKPSVSAQWFTTGVPFDYALSRNVTIHTTCYGYWASYINEVGTILATTCLRVYPHWMNDLRFQIGELRIRDIFIPGTHDSGSYRPNFDPLIHETLVTKYALCQDDDIRGQLMHGVRYLDIRVGYYRNAPEKFFINHGITKQRPLKEIIEQVKDFVVETNEIIIFGLKEFPVGFGKGFGVHRLLINYLYQQFGDLLVHPSATWGATLRDIWTRHGNIILAYDKAVMVQEHPEILFSAVDQRWGNVQTWPRLETHLRTINEFDTSRFSSRPVADMAELTPETFDVILDKHGGLRKMADKTNWRISQLYREELGEKANIVAVDFIRGTTLVETAIELNKRKAPVF